MDLSSLRKVETVNPRDLTYDLRYIGKTGIFNFSTAVFNRLGLENRGLTQYNADDGSVMLLIAAEEESVFMKSTEGRNKTGTFKNKTMASNLGFLPEDKEARAYYRLDTVTEEGNKHLVVLRLVSSDESREDDAEAQFEGLNAAPRFEAAEQDTPTENHESLA